MILDCYHLHHTKQNIYIPSLQGDPSGTFARRWHCASQDLKEWRHSSFRNAFQPHTLRPLKMNLLHDVATVMLLRDWCQHRFLSSIIIFYMCKHIYKLISWNWPINLLKDWLHKWLKWSTFTTAHGCFSNLGFHLPGHCRMMTRVRIMCHPRRGWRMQLVSRTLYPVEWNLLLKQSWSPQLHQRKPQDNMTPSQVDLMQLRHANRSSLEVWLSGRPEIHKWFEKCWVTPPLQYYW